MVITYNIHIIYQIIALIYTITVITIIILITIITGITVKCFYIFALIFTQKSVFVVHIIFVC